MKTILVFGSTSYLGEQAVRVFLNQGFDVACFARPDTNLFLLRELIERVTIVNDSSVFSLQDVDAIVNLGFVKTYTSYSDAIEKTSIFVKFLLQVAHRLRPRLFVQISTMAVFRRTDPCRPRQVTSMQKDEYADAKVTTENMLSQNLDRKRTRLVILRLGNVMGAGAPNWTGSIVTRILEFYSFGPIDGLGFSNVTYSGNSVSYLETLLRCSSDQLDAFGAYHHLAEFAKITWDLWIRPLADALGVDSEYIFSPSPPIVPRLAGSSGGSLFLRLLKADRLRRTAKALERILMHSSMLRGTLTELKQRMPYKTNLFDIENGNADPLRAYMLTSVEWENHVLPFWQPPVNFEQARERIVEGLGLVDQ